MGKYIFFYHDNLNLNFYKAEIFIVKNEIYFIWGKYSLDNNNEEYKKDIYCFDIYRNLYFNKKIVYMMIYFLLKTSYFYLMKLLLAIILIN